MDIMKNISFPSPHLHTGNYQEKITYYTISKNLSPHCI